MPRWIIGLTVACFAMVCLAGGAVAQTKDAKDAKDAKDQGLGRSQISGILLESGNGRIKIQHQGKEEQFEVAGHASITVEGRPALLDNLPKDRHVNLEVFKDKELTATGEHVRTTVVQIEMPPPWIRAGGTVFVLVLVVIGGAMYAGARISRQLRMPDHGWKIGVVLATILIGGMVTAMGWPPAFGIDLSGGVNLVYEIDQAQLPANVVVKLSDMADAIQRRVNPSGTSEIIVRPQGQNRIEIEIPKVDPLEIERIKERVTSSGLLEFRIVANEIDHGEAMKAAKRLPLDQKSVTRGSGDAIARWVRLDETKFTGRNNEWAYRENRGAVEVLIIEDPDPLLNVDGSGLSSTRPSNDALGEPCVLFEFKDKEGAYFEELTKKWQPEQGTRRKRSLGIVLDGVLVSAPNLNSVITGGRGEITGNFTEDEVKNLVEILHAGQLPAALAKRPISEELIDPLLGASTIQKAKLAMILASILVPLFMIVYYRFSGVVATLATALNVLLVLAFMLLIKAPLTLTGLAGLALTIGMAVDANVLIYERMREENARGAGLRMAIRNGFERALPPIIDAHLTTLIAATVLYMIGTAQVKGFAVTLWLGTLLNIFTATFCTHVMFDIAERIGLYRRIKMMRLIGETHYDFMGKQKIWFCFSAVQIGVGILAAVLVGHELFDIDFTGGSSVEVVFDERFAQPNAQKVKDDLDPNKLPDLAVFGVHSGDEKPGTRYRVVTSQRDREAVVEPEIRRAFEGKLRKLKAEVTQVASIPLMPSLEQPAVGGPLLQPPGLPPRSPDPLTPLPAIPDPSGKGETVPPTDVKPATDDNKPADSKPGDKMPPEENKPDENKKTGAAAPARPYSTAAHRTLPVLFLQEPDTAKSTDEPTKSAEATKAEPAAKAGEPAKSATESKDDPDKKRETTPLSPAKSAGPAIPATPSFTAPAMQRAEIFPGGTKAQLALSEPLSYYTLMQFIPLVKRELLAAAEATKDVEVKTRWEKLSVDISNPQFDGVSRTPFKEWEVRVPFPREEGQVFFDRLKTVLETPQILNSTTFESQVATDTRNQTVLALVFSWALIILYIWVRFQRVAYGVATVLALIHDVLVTIGALALCHYLAPFLGFLGIEEFKINLTIVAALLTIVGYSVNDTVVIFDRIREVKGKAPDVTNAIVNSSINQTLGRTLLTSFTVLLVILILYIFGGEGIHAFAFAMLIGTLTGTYSSIYIASPLLVWMERMGKSHREKLHLTTTTAAHTRT